MHTEITIEKLFDLFYEMELKTRHLDGILETMKDPKALLSIYKDLITVTLLDAEDAMNSFHMNITDGKYLDKNLEFVSLR